MRRAAGIILFNRDGKVLVEHPTNHDPNFWSFPKGMVDPEDASDFDAAKRECLEETDLDLDTIDYTVVRELPDITFKNKKKVLKLFVLRTNESLYDYPFNCPSMVTLWRKGVPREHPFPEVDDYKWVTIEEAYKLVHESQKVAIDML